MAVDVEPQVPNVTKFAVFKVEQDSSVRDMRVGAGLGE